MIFKNWHTWESNGKQLLSNEDTKELREFDNSDQMINWLFLSGSKEAARYFNSNKKVG